MTPLVFLDTETTSLRHDRRAWEVAMIRRESDGRESDITLYVQAADLDLGNADPFSLKVGRFHERHPDYWPLGDSDSDEEARVAEVVEEWTRGAHLVGAVPNFDAEVLDAMLRRHGFRSMWHYHLIDVEALAVGYLHGQGKTDGYVLPWGSDAVSRACGVEPPSEDERHTALGDARWAMRWYDAITGGAA